MAETSVSLLDRLRVQPMDADWQRLHDLYTPLIRGWLRAHASALRDADDVVQDVHAVVVRRLRDFEHQRRPGAFRHWLKTITVNCLRDHWRAQQKVPAGTGDSGFLELLQQLEDPHSAMSCRWDEEHDRHVTRRLLDLIRPRFEATTWQAFVRVALEGASPDETAAELGVSVNAIFIAKSRVLALLRQEGNGIIDE